MLQQGSRPKTKIMPHPPLWSLDVKKLLVVYWSHRVCHGCRKSVSPFQEPVVSIRQSTKFRSERSDFTRLPMVFGRISQRSRLMARSTRPMVSLSVMVMSCF